MYKTNTNVRFWEASIVFLVVSILPSTLVTPHGRDIASVEYWIYIFGANIVWYFMSKIASVNNLNKNKYKIVISNTLILVAIILWSNLMIETVKRAIGYSDHSEFKTPVLFCVAASFIMLSMSLYNFYLRKGKDKETQVDLP